MFWSISVKKLTEILIHRKRPCQSIIFVPRVLGACRSVCYVSSVSGKWFVSLYGTCLGHFLPVGIWCKPPYTMLRRSDQLLLTLENDHFEGSMQTEHNVMLHIMNTRWGGGSLIESVFWHLGENWESNIFQICGCDREPSRKIAPKHVSHAS